MRTYTQYNGYCRMDGTPYPEGTDVKRLLRNQERRWKYAEKKREARLINDLTRALMAEWERTNWPRSIAEKLVAAGWHNEED